MSIAAGQDILASHFNEIVPIGVVLPYAGSSAPTGFLLCDGAAVSRATYSALFGIVSTTFGAGDGSTTFNLPDMRSRVPVGAGSAPTKTFDFAYTAVDTSTEIITVPTNDSLHTGTPVVFTTTGTLPTGLSLATTYYVIRMSATTIKVATSLALALAGTAINITAQGSGTHTATVTYTARTLAAVGGEEAHANTIAEMAAHGHGVTDPGHVHAMGITHGDQDGSGSNGAIDGSLNTSSATTGITINETGGSTAHNNMQPYLALNFIIKYISYA